MGCVVAVWVPPPPQRGQPSVFLFVSLPFLALGRLCASLQYLWLGSRPVAPSHWPRVAGAALGPLSGCGVVWNARTQSRRPPARALGQRGLCLSVRCRFGVARARRRLHPCGATGQQPSPPLPGDQVRTESHARPPPHPPSPCSTYRAWRPGPAGQQPRRRPHQCYAGVPAPTLPPIPPRAARRRPRRPRRRQRPRRRPQHRQ